MAAAVNCAGAGSLGHHRSSLECSSSRLPAVHALRRQSADRWWQAVVDHSPRDQLESSFWSSENAERWSRITPPWAGNCHGMKLSSLEARGELQRSQPVSLPACIRDSGGLIR